MKALPPHSYIILAQAKIDFGLGDLGPVIYARIGEALEPLRRAASTTRVPTASPLIIRLRRGK